MNDAKQRIAVVGAGGFAREVAWLIGDINRTKPLYEFLGFVVSDQAKLGERDSRDQVLGDYAWLDENRGRFDALALGIGSPGARKKVALELLESFPWLEWPSLIHPTAQLDCASAQIGRGSTICAGVIGTVNLTLEQFSMVNLACTIGHESRLGPYCVLNPTVNISGGVEVGEAALVGTGAQILQYVRIGEGATVGAGAVVTKDVPPGETVVGIPAKPLMRA